jgi:hypothetical protein
LRRGLDPVALVDECGLELESAVALPPSESPSGICTFKTGRLPPPSDAELVLEGGVKPSGLEDWEIRFLCVLARTGCGGGGELFDLIRETAPTSTDCERLFEVGASPCVGSAFDVEDAQC